MTIDVTVSDVCDGYLHTLYWLLTRLNSLIQSEMEEFLKHSEEPTPTKKTEYTAPRLSPDVLSVGESLTGNSF